MKVNSLVSGGLTVGAADLVPAVNWALTGFHGPVPANLSALIAGGIVMALHAGYNYFAERKASKGKLVSTHIFNSTGTYTPTAGTTTVTVGSAAGGGGGATPAA
jgi:hypothetical protein